MYLLLPEDDNLSLKRVGVGGLYLWLTYNFVSLLFWCT